MKKTFWIFAYLLSDLLCFVIYRIIRYRVKTVSLNLEIAFPKKTQKERKEIEKKFYRNLSDFIIEMVFNFFPNLTNNKLIVKNKELIKEQYFAEGRNIMMLSGHFFNWEFMSQFSAMVPQQTYAVYKKQSNKWVEKLVTKMRATYSTIPFKMEDTFRVMVKAAKVKNSMFLFLSDQRPHWSQIQYDLKFFGVDTPVFNGFDKMARKLDFTVVYCDLQKGKRGEYTLEFKEICLNASENEENYITNTFFELLEESINKEPSNWLWTHKRWKYSKGVEF